MARVMAVGGAVFEAAGAADGDEVAGEAEDEIDCKATPHVRHFTGSESANTRDRMPLFNQSSCPSVRGYDFSAGN